MSTKSTKKTRAAAIDRISGIGLGATVGPVELVGPCPRAISGPEGSRVRVALGPHDDSWVLVLDEDDGEQERQIHLYNNIPDDMVQVSLLWEEDLRVYTVVGPPKLVFIGSVVILYMDTRDTNVVFHRCGTSVGDESIFVNIGFHMREMSSGQRCSTELLRGPM